MEPDIIDLSCPAEILEEDILESMKSIEGYLDIAPSDFKEFYIKAYQQARKRLLHGINAEMIMTTPATSVGEKVTLTEILNLVKQKEINRLTVKDKENRLAGIITRSDIIRSLFNNICNLEES